MSPVAVQDVTTLDQLLARQRELVLQREYVPLGQIDYIYIARVKGTVQIDYRKAGPRLAMNQDSGDLLLLTPWVGLPDRRVAEDAGNINWCETCRTTCPDCQGKGKKPCTLSGCAGGGYVMTKRVPCPECLGLKIEGEEVQGVTDPNCQKCGGCGEVPDPVKCKGCDDQGLAACARCAGSGQISTGRKGGSSNFDDPRCAKCAGERKQVRMERQAWEDFVNGRLNVEGQQMIALGPISRIVWHTLGENGRFQACDVLPDRGGNLMVVLLESPANGARQYLVGGVPQFN